MRELIAIVSVLCEWLVLGMISLSITERIPPSFRTYLRAAVLLYT